MKRITVSLPDEVADKVREAAGGDGKVSAFVAEALTTYLAQETLSDVLAAWEKESPISEEVRAEARRLLEEAGVRTPDEQDARLAG